METCWTAVSAKGPQDQSSWVPPRWTWNGSSAPGTSWQGLEGFFVFIFSLRLEMHELTLKQCCLSSSCRPHALLGEMCCHVLPIDQKPLSIPYRIPIITCGDEGDCIESYLYVWLPGEKINRLHGAMQLMWEIKTARQTCWAYQVQRKTGSLRGPYASLGHAWEHVFNTRPFSRHIVLPAQPIKSKILLYCPHLSITKETK